MTKIRIPDGVTEIEDTAFAGCSSLLEINIPDNVKEIGGGVFYGCSSLTTIDISPDNPNFKCVDNALFTKDGKILVSYLEGKSKNQKEYWIPDGVIEIGDLAFAGCSSLTEIKIPDGVVKIRDWAFSYCSSLTEIKIPNSVDRIGDGAFSIVPL